MKVLETPIRPKKQLNFGKEYSLLIHKQLGIFRNTFYEVSFYLIRKLTTDVAKCGCSYACQEFLF